MANFGPWQRANTVFDAMAAGTGTNATLVVDGRPERVAAGVVTANFFDVLGIRPALGRTFTADEDTPARRDAVLLGDALWRGRFGARPRRRRPHGPAERTRAHDRRRDATRPEASVSIRSLGAARLPRRPDEHDRHLRSRPPEAGRHACAGERGDGRHGGAAVAVASSARHADRRAGDAAASRDARTPHARPLRVVGRGAARVAHRRGERVEPAARADASSSRTRRRCGRRSARRARGWCGSSSPTACCSRASAGWSASC